MKRSPGSFFSHVSVILVLFFLTALIAAQATASPDAPQRAPALEGLFSDSGQSLGNADTRDVALGDLDGDGDLDAFVAAFANQPDLVYLNQGIGQGGQAGVFQDSNQELGLFNSWAVDLGDVDKDGDLDAFVAVRTTFQDNRLWLNNGAGFFADSNQPLGSTDSFDVALGDLDGNGFLDAFLANEGGNTVFMNSGGSFANSDQALGAASSRSVALGDLDGDGDLDAFVANDGPNAVWLNVDVGFFVDSGQSLGAFASTGVALGDLNGDGTLDAFVTNANQANTVYLNDGTGVFQDSGILYGDDLSRDVALSDVDGDGDLDAFIANGGGNYNTLWLNDGTGIFADSGQQLGGALISTSIALGDVDEDGDPDAFVGNSLQPDRVWLNERGTVKSLIDPVAGGAVGYTDTQGLPTTVQVPGGAVLDPIFLSISPLPVVDEPIPTDVRFANHAFDLNALSTAATDGPYFLYLPIAVRPEGGTYTGFSFLEPVTVTIFYSNEDVSGINENELRLYYWTGSGWADAATTCGPDGPGYTYHPTENYMEVAICHLSRYIMVG